MYGHIIVGLFKEKYWYLHENKELERERHTKDLKIL